MQLEGAGPEDCNDFRLLKQYNAAINVDPAKNLVEDLIYAVYTEHHSELLQQHDQGTLSTFLLGHSDFGSASPCTNRNPHTGCFPWHLLADDWPYQDLEI